MDELLVFVHARLDDEERLASAAIQGPWRTGEIADHLVDYVIYGTSPIVSTKIVQVANLEMAWQGEENAAHIVHQSPDRTRRDVQSRRKTLLRCQEEMLSGIPRLVWFAKMTVWEMAQRWNDHDDFKEGWKP
ncbi:DUF6221 family protein [Nonomuraea sp. NPDC049750]|uniref:DUF6221 family protein n=1 Tax=Nonomuraea sp. NPDC049750 TaxID=3154738 RepID=UPI0033E79762